MRRVFSLRALCREKIEHRDHREEKDGTEVTEKLFVLSVKAFEVTRPERL